MICSLVRLARLPILPVCALLQAWGKILGHLNRSEGLTLGHVMIARRKEEVTPACASQ